MPRMYEIPHAFENAMTRERARYLVSVRDFIRELEKLNHHFSPSQANDWIARYKSGWRLYEKGEYGFHVYTRFNPN
jgi:hypothetical protein